MHLNILSLGAGVQSTTLALMACDGTLPNLDGAIFADTGWEPDHVYEHLERLSKKLDRAGIPLYRVSNGNLRIDAVDPNQFAKLPLYIKYADGTTALAQRQCTGDYKLKPINRKIRELLGAAPPKFRTVPRGNAATIWIGFSTDEIGRVDNKRRQRYIAKRHPLLELGMSRKDCRRYLTSAGWERVAKSACIGCPFNGNAIWRDLRDNRPDEWRDAVIFDHEIRAAWNSRPTTYGTAYIHRSMQPLEHAPIDRLSRRDYNELQYDLFEDGDPDGCSPYGCRSGEPVTEATP